jgi:hypothetical protein
MNTEGTLFIVADLGHMKAYRRVVKSGVDPHETMQVSHVNKSADSKTSVLLEELLNVDYVDARTRISEEMSDKPGRFDVSTGEPHNMLLEKDRRGLKQIADDICKLVADHAPNSWHLAFPKETNRQLVEMLDANTAKKLDKNLQRDLTKVDKNDLLSHFE